MSKTEDGGFAFPNSADTDGPYGGLTIRDYFAGQVLAGIVSDPNVCVTARGAAEAAYEYADAMLRAREQEQGTDNAR